MTRILSLLFLLVAFCLPSLAAQNRYWLASQQRFEANRGFLVALENEAPSDAPVKLETLRLLVGSGDGSSWRFPDFKGPWEYERDYAVRAEVGPQKTELWLDGKRVAEAPGGFAPDTETLLAGYQPGWAGGPAEYLIRQTSLSLRTSGGKTLRLPFAPLAERPLPVLLFEPQAATRASWRIPEGESLTIETSFRIVRRPTVAAFAPYIDAFGQSRHARWPGKVTSVADLKRAWDEEARRRVPANAVADYDRFGGYRKAPWKEKATGFYRTVRRNDMWWLVSPEGHPAFYIGLCTAPALGWEKTPVTGRTELFAWLPPREGVHAGLWARGVWGDGGDVEYVATHSANLIRRYGEDWRTKAQASLSERLRDWGFQGLGKWCDPIGETPLLPVLNRDGVPNLARHPDVFDPTVQRTFLQSLRRQIEPQRGKAHLIGWSLGNEYGEIVLADDIRAILRKDGAVPAKRALVDRALSEIYADDIGRMAGAWKVDAADRNALYGAAPAAPPADDVEVLRRFYADRYYEFVYRTVKEIDPNHLYFGFWIVPGWWENEEDWRLIARHCDVVGYDNYAYAFTDERLSRLMQQSDKPVLCGEFSHPAWYRGQRGYGIYQVWAHDDAESGDLYARWTRDAARNPYCVGQFYFQYRDQPLTGRGPGHGPNLVYGEHYAFGLVDITDRPKWELVDRIRKANFSAVRERLQAKPAP